MSKGSRLGRLGVLAPAALSACIDASVMAAPAAGAIVSTVLKELSKAFMLKKWFHGVMSAQEAEQLLLQKGKQGSYLVRESRARPGELALSVRVRNRVSHVRIRKEQNKYHVGSGEFFEDLAGLIEHCRAYPLSETSGEVLRLRQPVSGARAGRRQAEKNKKPVVMMSPPKRMETVIEVPEDEEEPKEVSGNTTDSDDSEEYLLGEASYDSFYASFTEIKRFKNECNFTQTIGNRTINMKKNRYVDVVPYDQTRVHLPRHSCKQSDDFSDYINASFVRPSWMFEQMLPNLNNLVTLHQSDWEDIRDPDERGNSASGSQDQIRYATMVDAAWERRSIQDLCGNVQDKFYIATQGCLESTQEAFWEMVMDNDIRVIAMLTSCVENSLVKCDQYWPPVGSVQRFGNIIVNTNGEYNHHYYICRNLSITKDNKYAYIYQYQFKDWPDHGAPFDITSVLRYIRDVNAKMQLLAQNKLTAPKHNIMCVQCSAGIGRTGTLIAIDMLMDKIRITGVQNLNMHDEIPKTVRTMRKQRPGMVSTLRQYAFIRSALEQFSQEYLEPETPLAPHFSF